MRKFTMQSIDVLVLNLLRFLTLEMMPSPRPAQMSIGIFSRS